MSHLRHCFPEQKNWSIKTPTRSAPLEQNKSAHFAVCPQLLTTTSNKHTRSKEKFIIISKSNRTTTQPQENLLSPTGAGGSAYILGYVKYFWGFSCGSNSQQKQPRARSTLSKPYTALLLHPNRTQFLIFFPQNPKWASQGHSALTINTKISTKSRDPSSARLRKKPPAISCVPCAATPRAATPTPHDQLLIHIGIIYRFHAEHPRTCAPRKPRYIPVFCRKRSERVDVCKREREREARSCVRCPASPRVVVLLAPVTTHLLLTPSRLLGLQRQRIGRSCPGALLGVADRGWLAHELTRESPKIYDALAILATDETRRLACTGECRLAVW